MTDAPHLSPLFHAATIPARLASRYRPDLAAALGADAQTFGSGRQTLFALLVLVAAGYPLLASVLHAILVEPPVVEIDLFGWASNPVFYLAYSESLPFLIAVVAVGIFSPALGVLVVTIFAPADLVATVVSQATPNQFDPPLTAFFARLISYAVLWIGVVEVPLRARRWAAAWQSARDSASSGAVAVAHAAAIAVLIFFWGTALWWLIQPLLTWTNSPGDGWRQFTATWSFGWILAGASGGIALVAGSMRPMVTWQAEAGADDEASRPVGVAGQFLRVAVLAALLSGLMWDWTHVILIVGGLVVAGPILSMALPRLSLPAALARIPSRVRWVVAMVIAAGSALVVLTSELHLGLQEDYILLAVLLAVGAPLVRLIVELGNGGEEPRPAGSIQR